MMLIYYLGGLLLTLIFPIRPIDDKGPPYAVSLEIIKNVRIIYKILNIKYYYIIMLLYNIINIIIILSNIKLIVLLH